eukprot:4141305-Pyramimonas_sp.AAC.1
MHQEAGQITADSVPTVRMHGLWGSPCEQRATAPRAPLGHTAVSRGGGVRKEQRRGSAALLRAARLIVHEVALIALDVERHQTRPHW